MKFEWEVHGTHQMVRWFKDDAHEPEEVKLADLVDEIRRHPSMTVSEHGFIRDKTVEERQAGWASDATARDC